MTQPAPVSTDRWRIGVLLSGSGRTLANLLQAIDTGILKADIVRVVSSKVNVRGNDIARDAGIPLAVVERRSFADREAFTQATLGEFAAAPPDLLVMAGYLRNVRVLPEWEGRMLNIHPALLPDAAAYAAGQGMYGDRVHASVLARGDDRSGATVHVVTDVSDAGPPLARVEVPIEPADTVATLGARIFAAECALYPATIQRYLDAHPELRRG